jgi:hypothetical protein
MIKRELFKKIIEVKDIKMMVEEDLKIKEEKRLSIMTINILKMMMKGKGIEIIKEEETQMVQKDTIEKQNGQMIINFIISNITYH